jgi:snapalysin
MVGTRILARAAVALAVCAAVVLPAGSAGAVVGGRPASEDYSFLTYVGGCTGSLIKRDWVVTAGHCPSPETVRVGSNDATTGGTVATVAQVVGHPGLDVKLLRLAEPVPQEPVAIPSSSGPVGTATRIIGWGLTCQTPDDVRCLPPFGAHEADTSIIDDSRCEGIFGDYEICTDSPDGAGSCYGDSGGPQVTKIEGTWRLIGATSRDGRNDGTCGAAPSIYIDLPSIRPWISEQVGGALPS